ncbi:MAG: hypothetical protein Kapaf2KO_00270 [Candidatus Kapaibacteriales bacterium]
MTFESKNTGLLRFVCILFFLTLLSVSAFSSRTNLEIIDSLVSVQLRPSDENQDVKKLYERTQNSEFSRIRIGLFLMPHFVDNSGFDFEKHIDTSSNVFLDLNFTENPVKYRNDPSNSDNVIRTIEPKLAFGIVDTDFLPDNEKNSVKEYNEIIRPVSISYTDTVLSSDISRLEDSFNSFTKGTLPEPEDTLWDQVFQPVVVIGSAILSVWLLFSVRS